MGKIIQNILDSLKLTDEEDEFDEDGTFEFKTARKEAVNFSRKDKEVTPSRRFEPAKNKKAASASAQNMYYEEEEPDSLKKERISRMDKQQSGRIVPLRPANYGLEVCIMKPTHFEDSQDVCDMLKNERAIIVNLEGLDMALAQRIMDFISGAIYALNAKIHQISGYVFCISPEKVDISGDYMDMIEQTGFEVPNLTRH